MTTDREFKKLWELNPKHENPEHNAKNTQFLLDNILEQEITLYTGEKVDFKLIYTRLRDYLAWWDINIKPKGAQWIRDKEKLKSTYEYLESKSYESKERTKLPESDVRFPLLFGGLKLEQVEANFKHHISKVKKIE